MFIKAIAKAMALATLTCGLLLSSSSAHALSTGSNGALILAPAAPAVLPGALEANNLMNVFFESKLIPGAAIPVDVAAPNGVYGLNNTAPGSVGGYEVASYFIHFDPVGSTLSSAISEITFNHDIVGLIFLDSTLDATDYLGAAGTAYPTGTANRGFEAGSFPDSITWLGTSPNSIDINLIASSGIDQVRVITRTPEPETYVILAMGLMLACVARRRVAANAKA